MKKTWILLICAVLLFCGMTSALGEISGRLIRVDGSATVSLAADTATIQIGVNTRKATVREAQKENAEVMAAIMEALHTVGIEDQDIITSNFNVNSQYDYSSSVLGGESRTLYYYVENNVCVTIHDLSLIGKVLDAAMDAGANISYGITFSSSQQNEAYQKALTRAVEDAMQKAKVLAFASGVRLGNLVSINATNRADSYPRSAMGIANSYAYEAKTADAGTAITSGDVTVSAEVTLEYEFQQ